MSTIASQQHITLNVSGLVRICCLNEIKIFGTLQIMQHFPTKMRRDQVCAISGQAALEPVFSPKTKHVYEKGYLGVKENGNGLIRELATIDVMICNLPAFRILAMLDMVSWWSDPVSCCMNPEAHWEADWKFWEMPRHKGRTDKGRFQKAALNRSDYPFL